MTYRISLRSPIALIFALLLALIGGSMLASPVYAADPDVDSGKTRSAESASAVFPGMTRPGFAEAFAQGSGVGALEGTSAQAVPASITGTVVLSDVTFHPLAGVDVIADRFHESTGAYIDTTTTVTDASGEYELTPAGGGDFLIYFDDSQRRGASIAYDQQSFYGYPDEVFVADGGSITGIDAELPLPGSISGTVSTPGRDINALSADIRIYVVHNDPTYGWVVSGWYWWTSSAGGFDIDDLSPGEYQLLAEYDGPHGVAIDISPAFVVEANSFAWNPTLLLFSDVPAGHAFASEIAWLAGTGVSTGYPDGTFKPWNSVNRDAMAAFLYRFAGEPDFDPPAVSPFTDVPLSYPFYKEITWLASTGITTGYPDGTFKPLASVSRDAMAAFLYRFAGEPEFTPPAVSPFTDVPLSYSFYEEITWLAGTGITTGYPDSTFRPWNPVARDAMAAFLYRYSIVI